MQIKELGHVVLYVSNLEKSANFYKDILGFNQIKRGQGIALFSSGRTHHEMLLIEIGGRAPEITAPKPGLYHIGFKVGDSPEDLKKGLPGTSCKRGCYYYRQYRSRSNA
jgi:catechol-2,3-dioxygenase